MHGAVVHALKRFSETHLGSEAWETATVQAGLHDRLFVPTQTYPDDEVFALVGILAANAQRPMREFLQEFGEFMASALIRLYAPFVDPSWKTLDLLAETERTMHRVVRLRAPDASPPALECERVDARTVSIRYRSERRLCALAVGLIEGVARHFGETIIVQETTCMLRGDACCTLSAITA